MWGRSKKKAATDTATDTSVTGDDYEIPEPVPLSQLVDIDELGIIDENALVLTEGDMNDPDLLDALNGLGFDDEPQHMSTKAGRDILKNQDSHGSSPEYHDDLIDQFDEPVTVVSSTRTTAAAVSPDSPRDEVDMFTEIASSTSPGPSRGWGSFTSRLTSRSNSSGEVPPSEATAPPPPPPSLDDRLLSLSSSRRKTDIGSSGSGGDGEGGGEGEISALQKEALALKQAGKLDEAIKVMRRVKTLQNKKTSSATAGPPSGADGHVSIDCICDFVLACVCMCRVLREAERACGEEEINRSPPCSVPPSSPNHRPVHSPGECHRGGYGHQSASSSGTERQCAPPGSPTLPSVQKPEGGAQCVGVSKTCATHDTTALHMECDLQAGAGGGRQSCR